MLRPNALNLLLLPPITPRTLLCSLCRRNHTRTLPRRHALNIHRINLLERLPLPLIQEEVHDDRSQEVTAGKDVAVAEVNGARDEGGEEGNEKVPGPVAGGGEGHCCGAVAGGEDFGLDGPDHLHIVSMLNEGLIHEYTDRSPCCGISKNEKTSKDDKGDARAGC